MARVDELQEKYANIPREIIIKWELLRGGIRESAVLDRVSDWLRPTGQYQSRDIDVTMTEIARKRPDTVRPGYIMRPRDLYMKNGISVQTRRDSGSAYEVMDLGSGGFGIFEGEEKVEDVYFPAATVPWAEEPLTGKGSPVTSLVKLNRVCFKIGAMRYCEYFARGEQCKFCNFNATQDDARASGADVPIYIDLDETVEAYEIIGSQVRLLEGFFQMGGLKSREQEMKLQLSFLEKIASAIPYKPFLSMGTQPMSRKDLQRLKNAGLDSTTLNLEVWDPRLYDEILPGKAKWIGRERVLAALLDAVDILGAGNVGTSLVGSVTLMPANGHKTWQEARDSHIEGNRWLIKHGVFPHFHAIRLGVGSIYGDDRANRARLAPIEYYLDLALAHHEAMMEYDLYAKYNRKFMRCPLDGIASIYGGELGILAQAGDVGSYAAQLGVPEETNWLARFVSPLNARPTAPMG
ncbi:MAG: hypothetical protein Q7O66_05700 [Dehalococcoidia bacterium]|nr:hypothetical protein [Dehalococcoidia bacterium]